MAVSQDQTKYTSADRVLNESMDREFNVLATEPLGYDGRDLQRMNADNRTLLFDYDGGTNPVYIGATRPGNTNTAVASWQIRKLVYDGNNNITAITYADADSGYGKIWDNRASYSY